MANKQKGTFWHEIKLSVLNVIANVIIKLFKYIYREISVSSIDGLHYSINFVCRSYLICLGKCIPCNTIHMPCFKVKLGCLH